MLLARIDIEEKARLAGKRALNPGVEMECALGPQKAAAALQSVHLVQPGKLTIDSAAKTQARLVAEAQFGIDPGRRRRLLGQRPVVDAATRRHCQPGAQADANLPVSRSCRRVLVVGVQCLRSTCRSHVPCDRVPAREPLEIAAELDDGARRGRKRGVGAPSEVGEPGRVENRASTVVVVIAKAGRIETLRDREALGSGGSATTPRSATRG